MALTSLPDPALQLPPGYEPAPVWVPPGPSLAELTGAGVLGVGVALARPAVVSLVRAVATSRGVALPERRPAPGVAGDPGWFGPDSTAWKVQADPSMFVAGIAAFALQLLHPLALAGVVDHSSFADDFIGRVMRTGEFVQGVVYGDTAEAARRAATVRRIHRRVVGTAPDGRPYDASDPSLLEWVHLGEYLAIAAAFRRFGAKPCSDAELDAYVREVARAGAAVGVADPPLSWAGLDAALQRQRPALAIGEQALVALDFLREPPGLPSAARPAWRVAFAGAMVCMPPWARRLLRVPEPSPPALIACRSLVTALGALTGPPPPLVAARARMAAA